MPAVARLLTFVSILLATTARGQLSIFPPGPTSDDEVTLQASDTLRNTEVTLLDVPLDPRFRAKVRIYAFLDPAYFTGILPIGAGIQVGSGQPRAIALSRSCGGGECDELPYYGELDLPAGGEGESADVDVELPADALGWAFASVTNNVTQQVTVVAPAGKGGRP